MNTPMSPETRLILAQKEIVRLNQVVDYLMREILTIEKECGRLRLNYLVAVVGKEE